MAEMAIQERVSVSVLVVLVVVVVLTGTVAGQSPVPTPAHSPVATPEGPGVPTGFTPTARPAAMVTREPAWVLEGSGRIEVTPIVLPAAGAEYADGWRAGFGRALVYILVIAAAAGGVGGLAQYFGWWN